MTITIPVQNNVEVILADIYIKCEVKLCPMTPPRTTEGKIALESLEIRMNEWAHRLGAQILKEVAV